MFVCVPYFFFQNPENSNQNAFPNLSKTLYYQPRVLKLSILLKKFPTRARANRNSLHLTFVYVNFVSAIRSGTYQLLPRISFFLFSSTNLTVLVLITFKPLHVLVVSNGLGILRSTRQAEHDSTTTGQAKLVGIEPL